MTSPRCGGSTFTCAPKQRGSARDVIDWISWLQHVDYVLGLCDSTTSALATFRIFKRSASAERGRHLEGIRTV